MVVTDYHPDNYFVTWGELDVRASDRRVVLFGAGNACRRTAKKLDRRAECIVDNNPTLEGSVDEGLQVRSSNFLAGGGDSRVRGPANQWTDQDGGVIRRLRRGPQPRGRSLRVDGGRRSHPHFVV